MSRRRHHKKRLGNHGRLHHQPSSTGSYQQKGFFENQSLPIPICEFYSDGVITFAGDCSLLIKNLKALNEEDRLKAKKLRLSVKGQQVQKQDNCCLTLTFLTGLICCVPWFIAGTKWFKKRYRPLYNTSINQYSNILQAVELCPSLELTQINIQDNFLDNQKINLIEQIIVKYSAKVVINNMTFAVNKVSLQQEILLDKLRSLSGKKSFSFTWEKIYIQSNSSIQSQIEADQLL